MRDARTIVRKTVSMCYDHIGGVVGESFYRLMLDGKWIRMLPDGGYEITDIGLKKLEMFGISIERLFVTRRKAAALCVERHGDMAFEHMGAYLGALIAERMLSNGWVRKKNEKEYELTEEGKKGLAELGVKCEDPLT